MRYGIILLLLLSSVLDLNAQVKGDYNWVGGYQSQGTRGFTFNFNHKPVEIKFTELYWGFGRNIASISDDEGNLLFYCNGRAVFTADHQPMPNGFGINDGEWATIFWPYPQYGFPGPQDMLILPDPGNADGYYIIHKAPFYIPNDVNQTEIRMSYIDMSLNSGKGGVVFKNNYFYTGIYMMSSYLTALRHQNKKDWWIIQPKVEDSTFLTFLLDGAGIHRMEDQSTGYFFDKHRSSGSGSARFSPDGTRYAIYNFYDQLHVYDFDRETGFLSNHRLVEIYPPEEIDREIFNFGSVEWSPNSRFIYCSSGVDLFQVDTWEEDIQDGVRFIDTYNGAMDPFQSRLYLMVQAPDCKIYMTPGSGSYSLHVINEPDKLGTDCDFVQGAIKLPNSNGGGLPNFPRFRVDEEEKCDPTISSIFGQAVYYRRDLKAFPNPTSGPLTLEMPDGFTKGTLEIVDMRAGTVHRQKIDHPQERVSLDIGHLPAGVYHIELYPEENSERVFYGARVVLNSSFD